MKIALVTSIFPPDIGGPATHAWDLAEGLRERGHRVTVLTLSGGSCVRSSPNSILVPRRWPFWVRHPAVIAALFANRADFDVIYATGLQPSAVAAGLLSRKAVVVKVAGDPAWERGRRLGIAAPDFDAFQLEPTRGARMKAMRLVRDWWVRNATAVVAPSAHLAQAVRLWVPLASVLVVPNGVRISGRPSFRPDANNTFKILFVGRLIEDKRVDLVIQALAGCQEASLSILGNGPELQALRQRVCSLELGARVCFLGQLPHEQVLEHMAEASALALASRHEGLPHVAIESLACGTPVVAPAVGGIREVVVNGHSGILVDPPTAAGFAEAFKRLAGDSQLLSRLSWGALQDSSKWDFANCLNQVESLLAGLAAGKPRVVFLGKGGSGVTVAARLAVLREFLDPVIVSFKPKRAPATERRTPGVGWVQNTKSKLRGASFYLTGPAAALWRAGGRRSTIVCQSPYEGLGVIALSRLLPKARRPAVAVEVHGDWRTASALYGGSGRRIIAPLANAAAKAAIRRADRVRSPSSFTQDLVSRTGYCGDSECFPPFIDFAGLLDHPPKSLPEALTALFLGALQPTKGPDLLLHAWSRLKREFPAANLVIAGNGPMLGPLEDLATKLNIRESVSFVGHRTGREVAELLDASTTLVLPSRSEGFGRVILEAFARGRPVVAFRVGGVPELVVHEDSGLLCPPEDPQALAELLMRLAASPQSAARMGSHGRQFAESIAAKDEFRAGIARLAAWTAAR